MLPPRDGNYDPFLPPEPISYICPFSRMLQNNKDTGVLDINCCDPLGRSALLMAIDNENLEIIELLLDNKASASKSVILNLRDLFQGRKRGQSFILKKKKVYSVPYAPEIIYIILPSKRRQRFPFRFHYSVNCLLCNYSVAASLQSVIKDFCFINKMYCDFRSKRKMLCCTPSTKSMLKLLNFCLNTKRRYIRKANYTYVN